MTVFVDASALVAIITREAEADAFANSIERSPAPVTSAIAVFEAAAAVCRKRFSSVSEARDDIVGLLETCGIGTVLLNGLDAVAALDAFDRYGKGRGHPAQLNM